MGWIQIRDLGSRIRDPGFVKKLIQDLDPAVKKHRIQDPDPQTLESI
jgi:hypothetical protein